MTGETPKSGEADAPTKTDSDDEVPKLGIPESEGHKGTIAVEGDTSIEGLLLAYRAVGKIADHIASRVVHHRYQRVLIHSSGDTSALESLKIFSLRSGILKDYAEKLVEEASQFIDVPQPPGGDVANEITLAVAGAAITAGLQVLSLFRTDYQVKGFKAEIEDQVLAVTVAGALRRKDVAVRCTALIPGPPTADPAVPFVEKRLDELKQLRGTLIELRGQVTVPHPSKPTSGDKLEEVIREQKDPDRKAGAGIGARIEAAIGELEAFETGLTKVDEKSGTSVFGQVILAEKLIEFARSGAAILWLKAVAAGGTAHARTSTFKSDLMYSGGAIASFALFDAKGELFEADTIPIYAGFVRLQDLECERLTHINSQRSHQQQ